VEEFTYTSIQSEVYVFKEPTERPTHGCSDEAILELVSNISSIFISVFGASVWALMVVALTATQISINMLGHYPIGQERKQNIKQHILSLIYTPEIYHGQHHDTPNRAKLGAFDVVYYTLIRFFPHKS